jgi:hypothetical protein
MGQPMSSSKNASLWISNRRLPGAQPNWFAQLGVLGHPTPEQRRGHIESSVASLGGVGDAVAREVLVSERIAIWVS